MSNRVGGYYRKNGTYVSPDGYGRKRRPNRNGNDDFWLPIILLFFIIVIIKACS